MSGLTQNMWQSEERDVLVGMKPAKARITFMETPTEVMCSINLAGMGAFLAHKGPFEAPLREYPGRTSKDNWEEVFEHFCRKSVSQVKQIISVARQALERKVSMSSMSLSELEQDTKNSIATVYLAAAAHALQAETFDLAFALNKADQAYAVVSSDEISAVLNTLHTVVQLAN